MLEYSSHLGPKRQSRGRAKITATISGLNSGAAELKPITKSAGALTLDCLVSRTRRNRFLVVVNHAVNGGVIAA